jgi:hypothetical protein
VQSQSIQPKCERRRAARHFPAVSATYSGVAFTGPRYFLDLKEKLVGIVFMQVPAIRAAYHAELRAMVYAALTRPRLPEQQVLSLDLGRWRTRLRRSSEYGC